MLQRKDSNLYWVWIYALVKRWRRLLTNMETVLKNNYAFRSIVVRFWEIFTCLTCKQHKIKNRRHLLLTNPCIYTQKKRNVKADPIKTVTSHYLSYGDIMHRTFYSWSNNFKLLNLNNFLCSTLDSSQFTSNILLRTLLKNNFNLCSNQDHFMKISKSWETIHISLMKQQFVIIHTICQTQILTLLDSWVKNTPCQNVVSTKTLFLLIFL
jgi:hypothetical protein